MLILDGTECRLVVGADGYAVGRDGSAWSRMVCGRANRFGEWHRLNQATSHGYKIISVKWNNGFRRTIGVHILVLEAFVGVRPQGMEACHNDGNPGNPAIGNLRWDTPSANNRDKIEHGTLLFGSKIGNAKLSEDQVCEIIEIYSRGGVSMKALGQMYDVQAPAICRILSGQRRARTNPPSQMLTAFGETKTVEEWSLDSRCLPTLQRLRIRLARGWQSEVAITRQPESHGKKKYA
jgi:hypothetical protein